MWALKMASHLLAFPYPSIISHPCQAPCGVKDPNSQEPFNADGGEAGVPLWWRWGKVHLESHHRGRADGRSDLVCKSCNKCSGGVCVHRVRLCVRMQSHACHSPCVEGRAQPEEVISQVTLFGKGALCCFYTIDSSTLAFLGSRLP